jgi:hypothetical protein
MMARLNWMIGTIAAVFLCTSNAFPQSATFTKFFKVITGVKRHPTLTVDQFRAKWREHGEIVRSHPVTLRYLKKYVQHYAAPSEYEKGEPPFDGYVEQWFTNAQEYARFRADPGYTGPLRGLIAEFTDTTKRAPVVVEGIVVLDQSAGTGCINK